MFGWLRRKTPTVPLTAQPDPFPRDSAPTPRAAPSAVVPGYRYAGWDGEKFPTGYGPTDVLWADYWTLRARSAELFEKNGYGRGIVRRLITNEINTGLHLEAMPEPAILGIDEDDLAEWSENVETRFRLWGQNPVMCDQSELRTFGELQAMIRTEALVVGDVLVTLVPDQRSALPRVRLINGRNVQTPPGRWIDEPGKNRIREGVELDAQNRQVAYWVVQQDGKTKRLPARGPKTGRRLAWLVYGTDRRLDDVRGQPLLAIVLQSLKEIDRYRDATTRKAVANSTFAMFVQKDVDKLGTLPGPGAAVVNALETTIDSAGTQRTWGTQEHIPGVVINDLQVGETMKAFPSTGTDEKFGTFEETIIAAIAWFYEIPPEILRLSFSSNYSASQAAINEFKMYLNRVRTVFAAAACQPVYVDWLLSETQRGRIAAPGLLEAWRDKSQYEMFGAWVESDWAGQIKPAVDKSKLVKGYQMEIESGLTTRSRAARELNGMKYSKVIKQLARENAMLAEANAVLAPAPAQVVSTTGVDVEPESPVDDDRDEDGDNDENGDEDENAEARSGRAAKGLLHVVD